MKFDWNPQSALNNHHTHGVSFQEAATVFGDLLALTFANPDYQTETGHFVTFGVSCFNRLLVVAHEECADKTLILKSREVDREEREIYENG